MSQIFLQLHFLLIFVVLYKTPICVSPLSYTNILHSCITFTLSALSQVQILSLHYFLYILLHFHIHIFPYSCHSLVLLCTILPSSRIICLSVTSTFSGSIKILHIFIYLILCFLYITVHLDIWYTGLFSLDYSRYFHTLYTIV
jgi:hypothetical protein